MKLRLKVNKIFLLVILLFCLITSFSLISAYAESDVINEKEINLVNESNGINPQNDFISIFSFTPINDTECSVRLADKTSTRAIVPEKVEINGTEYSVTTIAANGFTSATKLEMVRLPKSVKTIGANAFANCKALTTITLPAVETIGANAFAMTKMDYLIIPTTVTSVAGTILKGANTQVYVRASLEEGATVPEGWVSNWNGSNKNQEVEFNSSYVPEVKYEFVSSEIATFALGDDIDLRTDGYYVTGFQEFCTIDTDDYKEVYIPATYTGEDGVEYPIIGIDSNAFYFNDIEKITIGYSELPITITTESFFGLNGSLITINREVELLSEDWEGNEVTSESVFACSTVSTIILPNSLQAIGNNMFDGCENLRDVHFIEPNGTLSPNAEANINLKLPSTQKIELPNTVTFIGESAFNLTKNILELYIPNSVESVGSSIISGWTSNQTVYVDFVADDPMLENWSEFWALESGNEDNANIVYKLSDKEYQITYNVDKEYHNNPNTYVSSEGLILLPVEMAGYAFEGWYLDESLTKPIESIVIGTAGDLHLFAKLVGNEYKIKYEKNCPSIASNSVLGDMDDSCHIFDEASSLNVNKYSLKGWTFIGWNTEPDGTGESYLDKALVTSFVESGIGKLYAQWEQKSYKLNYNGNRPNNATSKLDGNMQAEIHFYEDEYSLKKIAYTLEGWTFTGWNTEADGSGLTYKDEQIVKNLTETEINLYAQWEVSTYKVIYDKNKPTITSFEVEGVMNDSTHIYDSSSFLRTNVYTLEGWTFKGWNTEPDGSGKFYSNGAEIATLTSNGSIRLYAQWQANTYIIHYKPNRPNSSNLVLGETINSTHTVDISSTLSTNGYTLKGWTFKGWNTEADGSGISYNNKDNVKNVTTIASSIELYAQWEAKRFIIEYKSNDPASATSSVQGTMSSSNHLVDTTSVLKSNAFALKGWEFKEWNTDPYGNGTAYSNNSSIIIATDESIVKLYAQWKMNTYIIEYNSNGGSGAIPFIEPRYEDSYTLPENSYTYAGKHFTSWNTEADGSGISYKENQIVSKLTTENKKRITLYAQWSWNAYKIYYNSNYPNGMNNQIKEVSYEVNTPANLFANPYAFTGWIFKGWNTEGNGSGDFYEEQRSIDWICEDGATINLYAQWEATTYTITYNANLPMTNVIRTDNNPLTTYHTYDSASKINSYYTLVSWEMTGWLYNGTTYTSGQQVMNLVTNGGNITFVAQWKEKENVHDCQNSNGIYEIVSIDQLKGISQGSYKLMRDIKIEYNWEAIKEFTGTLDLDGHTIVYRYDSLVPNLNYGFILNNKGTIKNGYFKPYIEQSYVDTSQKDEVYIGGVVAENNGIISNVGVLSSLGKNNDSMTSDKTTTDINARSVKSIIGGIAGINNNTIENCTNNASIGGSYYIGGIAGKNKLSSAKINECTNEGHIWFCLIIDGRKCVGGVVGVNYEKAEITNCNNYEQIVFAYKTTTNTANEVYMASIVGWCHKAGIVSNCTSRANPIDNRVDSLTNQQLSFIKSNGESIGKTANEPDPAHIHLYTYYINIKPKGHTGKCDCGDEITGPHMIRSIDAKKDYANCKYCNVLLDLKNDMYSVEFDPYPFELSLTELNIFSNLPSQNYVLIEDCTILNEKDYEVDIQD